MTEGPWAHHLAARLRELLRGERLRRVHWTRGDASHLAGRRVLDVECWGKNLFLHFEQDWTFRIHLLMYGRIHTLPPEGAEPHNARLLLWTTRALVAVVGAPSIELDRRENMKAWIRQNLGPDPIRPDFDERDLLARLRQAFQRPLGPLLLDQRVVSGVGNIWKSEILHRARLDPRRAPGGLSREETERLITTVRETMREVFRNHEAQRRNSYAVYRRTGRPCRACGGAIESFDQDGRATFACARCQGVRTPGSTRLRPRTRGRASSNTPGPRRPRRRSPAA